MPTRPGWTPGALRLKNLRAHPDRLKVENAGGGDSDTATLWVYDEISLCGVTADAFCRELDTITASAITLRLNSPGGDLFDGIAIHNSLATHPARVTVQVDGLAASCASVIAMAGDEIVMQPGSQMMLHEGFALCIGNAADMKKAAAELDQCSGEIAGFYARRAGGDRAAWRDVMLAETWYTGPEAVEAGLADRCRDGDETVENKPIAAKFDLSLFNYQGRDKAPPPRRVTAHTPVLASPMGMFNTSLAQRAKFRQDLPPDLAALIRDAVRKA